jgi:hypothetical protein
MRAVRQIRVVDDTPCASPGTAAALNEEKPPRSAPFPQQQVALDLKRRRFRAPSACAVM